MPMTMVVSSVRSRPSETLLRRAVSIRPRKVDMFSTLLLDVPGHSMNSLASADELVGPGCITSSKAWMGLSL
jgi:hypothetical protein